MKTVSGSFAKKAHGSITRSLLKDSGVKVVSEGKRFYNANRFSVVHFIFAFCDWVDQHQPDQVLHSHIQRIWNGVRDAKGENKIVIASTPDQVSLEYLSTLDGGILHEAFHSLYSLRGELDTYRVTDIVTKTYTKGLPYGEKSGVLKNLMNIYEDSYIERMGFKEFAGAPYLIQRVHELVWEMEKEVPRHDPVSEFMCALRDRVENYLTGAPFNSYSKKTLELLDTQFGDLIERGRTTEDPYEVLELALATFARLFDTQKEGKKEEEEKEEKEKREGNKKGDTNEEEGEDENTQSNEEGEKTKAKGEEEKEEGEEGGGGAQAFKELQKAFATTESSDLIDIQEALNHCIEEEMNGSDLTHALPWTQEYDTIRYVPPARLHDKEAFRFLAERARQESLFIRPKVVSLLRGTKKVRNHHGRASGRRLSGRAIHEVVYKKDVKPFVQREVKITEDAAVSIALDESGSMSCETARYILAIFAVTFQDLRIPFEVIGFQQQSDYKTPHFPREELRSFTRASARTFNVFRTFDEGFSDDVLAKLMRTRADGGTPILDGLDFAGRRLMVRPESKKLLIVITDGDMGTDTRVPLSSRDLIEITNREINLLETHGVTTMMVGIGYSSNVASYKNHIQITNTEKFSQVMNDYLLRALLTSEHGRGTTLG